MIQNNLGQHTKPCKKLCCKVNKIQNTLRNLVNQIRCRSPGSINQVYSRIPIEQRPISSQYVKVTETINNIDGVQYFKIPRHYTDNTQMKKALQWDQKEQFRKPQQEYYSQTIKLKHDRKKQELERIRQQGQQKDWHHNFKSKESKSSRKIKEQSPRFNNQIIQQKTKQNEIQASSSNNFDSDFQNNRYNKSNNKNFQRNSSSQKVNRRYKNQDHKNDYMYRKKIITRYRSSDEASVSSTDSQFSRYQL